MPGVPGSCLHPSRCPRFLPPCLPVCLVLPILPCPVSPVPAPVPPSAPQPCPVSAVPPRAVPGSHPSRCPRCPLPRPRLPGATPGPDGRAPPGLPVVLRRAVPRGEGGPGGAGAAGGGRRGPGAGPALHPGRRRAGDAPARLPLEPRRPAGRPRPRQPAARLPGVQAGLLRLPQHGVHGLPQPHRCHPHRGGGQGAGRGGGGGGRPGRERGDVHASRQDLRLLPQALPQRRGGASRQQRGAAPRPQLHRQRPARGRGLRLLPPHRLLRPPGRRDGAGGAALQPLLPGPGHRHGPPHLQRDPGIRGRYPGHHVADRQGHLHLPAVGSRAGARPPQTDGLEDADDLGAAGFPPVLHEAPQMVCAEEQENGLPAPQVGGQAGCPPPRLHRLGHAQPLGCGGPQPAAPAPAPAPYLMLPSAPAGADAQRGWGHGNKTGGSSRGKRGVASACTTAAAAPRHRVVGLQRAPPHRPRLGRVRYGPATAAALAARL